MTKNNYLYQNFEHNRLISQTLHILIPSINIAIVAVKQWGDWWVAVVYLRRTRWWAWVTVMVPTRAGGHTIYSVVPLPMHHIKTTNKVKNRLPPLRIRSYGRPFAKMVFSHSFHQFCYCRCKTMRKLMRCSTFFTEYRVRNEAVGIRTRGWAWAMIRAPNDGLT